MQESALQESALQESALQESGLQESGLKDSVLQIEGGVPLNGSVSIAGAKNAVLPILAAGLLVEESLKLENVPQLQDTNAMLKALREVGAQVEVRSHNKLEISMVGQPRKLPSGAESAARNIRTGVLFLGPMLARFGWAQVCMPGGCQIGKRPLDLHLWGLEKLGAQVTQKGDRIEAQGKLQGTDINLPFPSVGASENLIMAATLARGSTRLRGVAQEPEVADLCRCLRAMGANIEGEGSTEIIIEGKGKGKGIGSAMLHGATHRLMPDRIEVGSYALALAATGGSLLLRDTPPYEDSRLFFEQLRRCGLECIEETEKVGGQVRKNMRITRMHDLRAVSISTAPHPGFATDLQAQFTAAMCFAKPSAKHIANPRSQQVVITENVFENRFMHLQELQRMGAKISQRGRSAYLTLQGGLQGASVRASDLRASFSLVIAALAAQGTTTIYGLHHLDRGYESIEAKLSACGARIKRIEAFEVENDKINHKVNTSHNQLATVKSQTIAKNLATAKNLEKITSIAS